MRYVGEREATVWVETDAPAAVGVCGAEARTFEVSGHHYAIVCVDGLEPGERRPYSVTLDGEEAWPAPGDPLPPPEIRTPAAGDPVRVSFGSCRVSAPHEPPYTLPPEKDPHGREHDALRTLALRLLDDPEILRPHLLLLLGDQIYADEVSPGTREFIRSRRDTSVPPGEQVADFEEYTHLYLDSWSDPYVRWLLASVPTGMIFDDHDVHDDWNISASWVRDMRANGWWDERIVAGLVTYWIYQHLGNLAPADLAKDEVLARVRAADGDAGPILREFAFRADRDVRGAHWSFARDLGRTRLIVMDSRAGRVLEPGARAMLDPDEWAWVTEQAEADGIDHLLLGTSLPVFLAPALHHGESWNEAVCDGAWGRTCSRLAERMRQMLDLEHWAAFRTSFDAIVDLLERIATRPDGPASIVLLSGDVHHAFLARVGFGADDRTRAPVWQAVCSPMRNPLGHEQRVIRLAFTRGMTVLWRALARLAGVERTRATWELQGDGPWFDNQVATLDVDGRAIALRIEKAVGRPEGPCLEAVLDQRLA